jgi:hypothetical protein
LCASGHCRIWCRKEGKEEQVKNKQGKRLSITTELKRRGRMEGEEWKKG